MTILDKNRTFPLSRYKEVCDYDFNSHKSANGKAVGHFTQVVWKTSLQLGIGKATKDGCTYVVGRYKPPGNWMGKEAANVFKGTYDESFCKNPKWAPSGGGGTAAGSQGGGGGQAGEGKGGGGQGSTGAGGGGGVGGGAAGGGAVFGGSAGGGSAGGGGAGGGCGWWKCGWKCGWWGCGSWRCGWWRCGWFKLEHKMGGESRW